LGARLPSFTGSSLVCSLVCWLVGRSWAGWLASWFLCGVALDLCLLGSSHPAAPLGRFVWVLLVWSGRRSVGGPSVRCLAVRRLFGRRSVLVRRLARWLVGWLSGGRCLSVGWVLLCGWLGRAAGRARVVCVACVCLRVSVRVSGRVWLGACGWLWVRPARVCVVGRAWCVWCVCVPPVCGGSRGCVCVWSVCVCSDSLLPLELPGRARSRRSAKRAGTDSLGWGLFGGLCLWVEASV